MRIFKNRDGISQVRIDNNRAETERLSATLDYVAMMADIEIPTEDTEDTEAETDE